MIFTSVGIRWLLLFLPWVLAAQPLQRGNVDLRVRHEAKIETETQWDSSWGTFSKDYLNSRVLDIALRQIGGGDSTVLVQWYFVGRDYDAKKLFIYDSGEFTGDIAQGGVKLLPYSKKLISTRDKMRRSNQLTGAHPWGWCVVISQKGRLLEEKASVPEMVQWTLENRDKLPSPVSPKRPLNLRFVPQALGKPPT